MSSIEDQGRADPEILRKAGIPHVTSVGRIEQLTETPVRETGKIILPLIGKRGEEKVYPVENQELPKADWAEPKIPPPEILMHEWSYAITPILGNDFYGIYITGFCKRCQTAFTAKLGADMAVGYLEYTKLDIPLFGCEYKRH